MSRWRLACSVSRKAGFEFPCRLQMKSPPCVIEVHRTPWVPMDGYISCSVLYSDGKRTTIYQHRKVMQASLNRVLRRDETVHHIDENRSNNDLANLEVLTRSEHGKRHSIDREVPLCLLACIVCGKTFERKGRTERRRLKLGRNGPFCSKVCSGDRSRQQQIEQGVVPRGSLATHGRDTYYTYHRCRCSLCKKAHAEANRNSRNPINANVA